MRICVMLYLFCGTLHAGRAELRLYPGEKKLLCQPAFAAGSSAFGSLSCYSTRYIELCGEEKISLPSMVLIVEICKKAFNPVLRPEASGLYGAFFILADS